MRSFEKYTGHSLSFSIMKINEDLGCHFLNYDFYIRSLLKSYDGFEGRKRLEKFYYSLNNSLWHSHPLCSREQHSLEIFVHESG